MDGRARELMIERIVTRVAVDDLIAAQAELRRERGSSRLLLGAVVLLTLALVWVGGRSVRAINDCESPVYIEMPSSSAPLENSPTPSQNGVEVWI